jgi:hypothetical protein
MRAGRALFILYLSFWGGLAHAAAVYINGVRVDGAVNLKLSGVDVQFDAAGDLWISARNYKVEAHQGPAARATPPVAPPPRAVRRYYLQVAHHGDAQWDIDVFINDSFVRRIGSREAPAPIEVTRLMHMGENRVRMRAVKQEGPRTSISESDFLEVTLGEGTPQAGGEVAVDKFYSYRRTAAEAGLFTNDATVTLR